MKQKKLFSKFKMSMRKVMKNLKNKNTGFFILVLCICLVATALVWKYTKTNDVVPEHELDSAKESVETNEDPYKDWVNRTIEDYEKAMLRNDPDVAEAEQEISLNSIESFGKPIIGEIVREFNINELVYFETIEEWRTHQGIDIKPEGTLTVTSCYDGTVEKVEKTSVMGVKIVINHKDNIKTIYACLSSSAVKEGDTVKKGDKIGTLGVIENIEMSQGPHLHFEISINNKIFDPTSLYTK